MIFLFDEWCKACEDQESCRDGALILVHEFIPILFVHDHEDALRQRTEMRRAVQVMLDLIEETSEYILNRTSSRVIGKIEWFWNNRFLEVSI